MSLYAFLAWNVFCNYRVYPYSFGIEKSSFISKQPDSREKTMNTFNQSITQLFAALFDRGNNDDTTQNLLERANHARGQSAGDAAELRHNALALLSVVR
jgi:hypothetical protein